MVDADRPAFKTTLEGVYALYRADISPGVIAIWWQALARYDLAAVREAFGRHAVNPDTGQFLPKPADVVKMLEGSTKDSALIAWTKVLEAIKHVGHWSTVAFDDPLIHVVIEDMAGWMKLCECTEEATPFVAKEFCERYRAYRARSEVPKHQAKLLGYYDAQNLAQGYPAQRVVLIGDARKAQQVLTSGADTKRLQFTTAGGEAKSLAALAKPRAAA